MADQEFSSLAGSGVLAEVELIVVRAHQALNLRQGRPWSPPDAYRWLRYEDPEPVKRLSEGVRKLRRRGVQFEAGAVDKACARASEMGFLN